MNTIALLAKAKIECAKLSIRQLIELEQEILKAEKECKQKEV